MRLLLVAFSALAAVCAVTSAPSAQAQNETPDAPSVAGCVAGAGSQEAMLQCKGIMSGPCLENEFNQHTAGMVMCFNAEVDDWEALLDSTYALAEQDADRRELLDQSRAAWVAWREAQCAYDASIYAGGSLARVVAAACWRDRTAERAIALIWAGRELE